MMKNGLVIEGGGFRGAYTAGALSWLLDNNIEFAYGVGISIGALYLCAYLTKNKQLLYETCVNLAAGKDNVGLKPLLSEGTLVGYEKMFSKVKHARYQLDIEQLIAGQAKAEIGIYDLGDCTTKWLTNRDFDRDLLFLKAACTLPMFGKKVKIGNREYLDGGITTMIPIQRSINNDNDRHLVITTKPAGYVRKPYKGLIIALFKLIYHRYPKLAADMRIRSDIYYRELAVIDRLVEAGRAMHIRPSHDSGVTRFSGSRDQLLELFELGYQDMEQNKESIKAFLAGENK